MRKSARMSRALMFPLLRDQSRPSASRSEGSVTAVAGTAGSVSGAGIVMESGNIDMRSPPGPAGKFPLDIGDNQVRHLVAGLEPAGIGGSDFTIQRHLQGSVEIFRLVRVEMI